MSDLYPLEHEGHPAWHEEDNPLGLVEEKVSYSQAIMLARDFAALELPPRESLIHPIIKEQSIIEIYGPRGVGKTMFAQSLGYGIASGKGFAPWEAGKQVPVLYLEGEMPAQDIIERLEMLGTSDNLYIYSDCYASLLGLPKASLVNEKWQQQMKDALLDLGAKFWVVDNLASLTAGVDEISKRDYDPINQFFLDLRFAGISTAFVHHSGKSGQQRGSSAKEDNVDTVIKLSYPPDYTQMDGCRFILTFEKARLKTSELAHTRQMEFTFTQSGKGKGVWFHTTVKAATKIAILRLLDDGLTQKRVAEQLDVDKGYVSRVRSQAIEDNLLTKGNRLTQTGYRETFEEDKGVTTL